MKLNTPDFLVLNLSGIDLFLKVVDQMMLSGAAGGDYEACVKQVQQQIHDYSKQRDAFSMRPTVSVVAAPLTLTVGELLSRNVCRSKEFRGVSLNVVYIIRDGGIVLYVGSTRYNARTRMKSHQNARSPLGTGLREDPNAMNWNVEMIPHADYRAASEKEKELIVQLDPAFCRRPF